VVGQAGVANKIGRVPLLGTRLLHGAGALAPDAVQAAGRNRAVINTEPEQRTWGSFGFPFFFVWETDQKERLGRRVLV
jgi:hypothetical protein